MKQETLIQGEAEMIRAGTLFSQSLPAGAVIALDGDLGAGKTHFAKGIVAGLGSRDDVTSPTFSLVNVYRGGRSPVFHFDFYRLESLAELENIAWEEYLDAVDREGAVLIVEWAGKFPEALPDDALWCQIEILSEGNRRLTVIAKNSL